MKVVLINTQTPGGAYVACQRLGHALQKQGIEASLIEIKATKWNFLWERFCIWIANRFSRKNLFAVSIANTGTDISKLDDNYRLYPIGITPIDYNDKLTNWI